MNKFYKISIQEYSKSIMKMICSDNNFEKNITINVEASYNDLKLPSRSTRHSAGYDFIAPFTFKVEKNRKYIIPTGIKCEMSKDNVLLCFPRSSYGFKYGFRMLNTIPVIDSDYYNNSENEGHIMLGFMTDEDMVIKKGDKLFQAIITKFYITEDDNSTEDRKGGIGSTGE